MPSGHFPDSFIEDHWGPGFFPVYGLFSEPPDPYAVYQGIIPIIEVLDLNSKQYRLTDARSIRYSNHYSEEGSGFGYLTFSLPREVGHNYNDIGFGYEVILRKGIRKILFHGVITKIEEVEREDGDQIEISCVGMATLLTFSRFNRILSESRINRWKPETKNVGSAQPDKFDTSTSWEDGSGNRVNGLMIEPRRGVDFLSQEFGQLTLSMPFGESIRAIKFDYELAVPSSWPGELVVTHPGVPGASGTLQVTTTANSVTGSFQRSWPDSELTGSNTSEIYFFLRVTAAGENTAADNTVYARLTNVVVSTVYNPDEEVSSSDLTRFSPIRAYQVGEAVISHMATNFSFSADKSGLEDIGRDLDQAAFDADGTPADALKYVMQFGDENLGPLSWGVERNDKKRIFLARRDVEEVKYIVSRGVRSSFSVSGDLGESAQKVYGVINEAGETKRTATYSDQTQIDALGGLYREEALQLSQLTSAQAAVAAQMKLSEIARPRTTSSVEVSPMVFSKTWARIPVFEIEAGGLVVVDDFRGREVNLEIGNDLRTQFTTFELVGVEIDVDARSATLIPAGDRSRFEKYMANLARMAKR